MEKKFGPLTTTTWEEELRISANEDVAEECTVRGVTVDEKDDNIKKGRALLDPEDNFKSSVDAIARYLVDYDEQLFNISVSDRNKMCRESNTPNVKYYNAAAFVLGYWIINRETIDMKRWNKIYSLSKGNKEPLNIFKGSIYEDKANVYPADVIRYARLWLNIGVDDYTR